LVGVPAFVFMRFL